MKTKTVKKTRPVGINFKHLFARMNDAAHKIEMNSLPEVGVFDSKILQDVTEFLLSLPVFSGISSDNLPYTPRLERMRVALNTAFNINLNCWHVWQIVLASRKNGILPKSGTSRKTSAMIKSNR